MPRIPGLSSGNRSNQLRRPIKLTRRALKISSVGKRDRLKPAPDENPAAIVQIQILGCTELVAKDRNGSSDPFVVVTLLGTRYATPSIKRTTNPVYNPLTSTFSAPVYISLAGLYSPIELVVWDKDIVGKEYLGEVSLSVDQWFEGSLGWDEPGNKIISLPLQTTRRAPVTGSIQIKIGFLPPPTLPDPVTQAQSLSYMDIWIELHKRRRTSLMTAPATEGIGTIRSENDEGAGYFDDGGLSSDEGEDDDDEESGTDLENDDPYDFNQNYESLMDFEKPFEIPSLQIPETSVKNHSAIVSTLTPTQQSFDAGVADQTQIRPAPKHSLSKILRRPRSQRSSTGKPDLTSFSIIPVTPTIGTSPTEQKKVKRFTRKKGKQSEYNLSAESDIKGIVMLEVLGAIDLPKLSNLLHTTYDMDPFVVIAFGKKIFRTRVIRHSRTPNWNEKLLFHVRQHEEAFQIKFTVLDWDNFSGNDYVAETSIPVSELIKRAPKQNQETGLYESEHIGGTEIAMIDFELHLQTAKDAAWEARHRPILQLRAKYQPYAALRQKFWRTYLQQYDTDDSGYLSQIEITSMLDSLGSTLSAETISGFFTRWGVKSSDGELSLDQAVNSLEKELGKPDSQKKRISIEDSEADLAAGSQPVTPGIANISIDRETPPVGILNFSGPDTLHATGEDYMTASRRGGNQQTLADVIGNTTPSDSANNSEAEDALSSPKTTDFERVINVKNCPLCHRPRLSKRAEVDIITHLAVCASQDWGKVDRMIVGNFVTASQAQRKWYSRIMSKFSAGEYRIGANSANIIVQNRMTGQLEEEKMQVYVRMGIRILYKGAKGRMEGGRARRLLKSMSIKQGQKYDSPESARDIPTFISFHGLNVDQILDPLDSFKTFNQFFYRKLKPDARPVELPEDSSRLVSGADCRMMAFESVSDAQRLWIKGREFTVARLLGDNYKSCASRYAGGAVGIFRLAPQDYHRFHCPVDGKIGKITEIAGEYYTVNPQAIRTTLDVYGENVRKIVPIDSPKFGRVMAVCIGAMMVGSIHLTVEEGDEVKRGQEFGYFAFGGSTIVVLFEKDVVQWDDDLINNGRSSLETLVQVGMGIGRSRLSSTFQF